MLNLARQFYQVSLYIVFFKDSTKYICLINKFWLILEQNCIKKLEKKYFKYFLLVFIVYYGHTIFDLVDLLLIYKLFFCPDI